MTESIFDPTGRQTEHSGMRNLGPEGGDDSHMPPDVVDGQVEDETGLADQDEATEQIARAERAVDADHPGQAAR